MAYKFQLGASIVSGSLTRDAGDLVIRNHANAVKAAITASSGNAKFEGNLDAVGDLTVGTITMAEFTVAANGNTDIDGTLNVEGVPTFQAKSVHSLGAEFADQGLTSVGSIADVTSIDGTGDLTMGTITMTGMSVDADGDLTAKSVVGTTTVQATTELSGATLSIGGGDVTISDAGAISGSSNLSLAGNISASFGQVFSDNAGALYATDLSASLDLLGGQDAKVSRDVNAARDLIAGRNLVINGTTRINTPGDATLAITTVSSLSSSGDLEVVGAAFLGDNLGVSGSVTLAGITADTALEVANDGLFFNDGRNGTVKNVNVGSFVTDIAGAGLEQNLNVMRIAASAAGAGLSGGGGSALALDLNELGAGAVDVAADSIAIVDANDGNASKKESIADLVAAIAGSGLTAAAGVLSTEGGSTSGSVDGATLSEGYNFLTGTAGGVFSMPEAVGSVGAGSRVIVKNSSAGTATINAFALADGDAGKRNTIDSASSIVLESPFAAVTLVYSATSGSWAIV